MSLHVAAENSANSNCLLLTPLSFRPQMPPPKRSSTNGRRRAAELIDVSKAYPKLAALGYEYGPAFRGLRSVCCRGARGRRRKRRQSC